MASNFHEMRLEMVTGAILGLNGATSNTEYLAYHRDLIKRYPRRSLACDLHGWLRRSALLNLNMLIAGVRPHQVAVYPLATPARADRSVYEY
jgi:hypothetical protein